MDQKKYLIYDESTETEVTNDKVEETHVEQESKPEPIPAKEENETPSPNIKASFIKKIMTCIAIIILTTTGFFIYKAVMRLNTSDNVVNDVSEPNNQDNIYSDNTTYEEHRITVPPTDPSTLTLQQTMTNVGESVSAITAYYNDLKNVVTKMSDQADYDASADIKKIKSSLLEDIETLARYRVAYETYNGKDLYLTFADRLQNAYNFANAIAKSTSDSDGLITIANEYIGNESTLNVRAKVNTIKMLEDNEIEYELSGDIIKYEID